MLRSLELRLLTINTSNNKLFIARSSEFNIIWAARAVLFEKSPDDISTMSSDEFRK